MGSRIEKLMATETLQLIPICDTSVKRIGFPFSDWTMKRYWSLESGEGWEDEGDAGSAKHLADSKLVYAGSNASCLEFRFPVVSPLLGLCYLFRGVPLVGDQVNFFRPLVSVVVPSMNASRFIEAALLSAVAQTYDNLEIIVVDDGSTDDTVEIVRSLMVDDGRIRLIEQANAGVAAARNAGIAAAQGKYLAPLDADDTWSPEKIERQVQTMESAAQQLGMVYCWWYSVSESGEPTGGRTRFTYQGNVFLRLLYQNFVGNASVPLYRMDAVRGVRGYDEKPRKSNAQGCEDWDLALRVAREHPIGVVCEDLSGYRDVKGSMSSRYIEMARSHQMLVRHWRRSVPGLPSNVTAWSRSYFCMWLAGKAYGSGHYWNAFGFILRASVNDPAVVMLPWAAWILFASGVRGVISPLHRVFGISNRQIHEFKKTMTSDENQNTKSRPIRWIRSWVSAMNRRYNRQVSSRMLILSGDNG